MTSVSSNQFSFSANSFQIQLRHRNLTLSTHSSVIQSTDIVLYHTLISFDMHLREIIDTLIRGGQLVLLPPNGSFDINVFSRTVSHQQVTCLNMVPSLLTTLIHHLNNIDSNDCWRTLRSIIFQGIQ